MVGFSKDGEGVHPLASVKELVKDRSFAQDHVGGFPSNSPRSRLMSKESCDPSVQFRAVERMKAEVAEIERRTAEVAVVEQWRRNEEQAEENPQ